MQSDIPSLTLIIPTLNTERSLPNLFSTLKASSCIAEILVVDGGSTDRTREVATASSARVISAPRGRGVQLAAGAKEAREEWLLFLHADSQLEAGWQEAMKYFIVSPANQTRAAYFRFALDDDSPAARRLEKAVAWRGRWLGVPPYGDQGLLIHRSLYDAVGGYAPVPLMEDVDLVCRIGKQRLVELPATIRTSAERYRRDGYLRRSARNLVCLALWWMGVSPHTIARLYA